MPLQVESKSMLWQLVGGVRGLLMLAGLAAAGTLIPWKFGFMFLDPAIILPYTAIAILFASNFVAGGVVGQDDLATIRGITFGGALYGWLCWVLILGTAFAALASFRDRMVLPPSGMLAALALFTVCVAWLSACLAALVSVQVFTAKAARDLMRMGFFFVVLLMLIGSRFLPAAWRTSSAKLLTGEQLPLLLCAIGPVLAVLGVLALRRIPTLLADRHLGLSITGE
ncbi:hypothetical protein [Paludibaculum fermentans]|uniref:Uncharacterized protein n=1 Tax=Paludibaculum fermentans TaxID=1473598 RepID=A0A7S7NQI4_PALFE|nr:hypothetical protein [Paludibaculum fermentans]QOY87449.1 hypothetical protein IRI77_32605 [Paludibaculum fermentans]